MPVTAALEHFTAPVQVIVDAAPSGMMLVNQEGSIVMANQLLAQQFGYSPEELLGQSMEMLIPERFRSNHPAKSMAFFAAPEPRPMGCGRDLYGQRKDGTEFPVEIGLNPLTIQDTDYVFASLVDITERKRREEQHIAALSHRLFLATQSANIGIWEWDVVQNTLTWDAQMYVLYGLSMQSKREPYSMWVNALHPDDREAAEDALQLALQGKKEFNIEFRVIWPDGSLHYIKGAGLVDQETQGTHLRMIGVNWDITAGKRGEEILRTHTRELERSNQELDDFAYITSHDLKEPLRGIHNFSTILLEDHAQDLNDDGRVRCETLCRLSCRMEELLDALLYFSRTGRTELALQVTDIDEVLDGILETLDLSLKEHGVFLKVSQTFPKVYCDAVRVGEIFRNLITNAMKYNDKEEKWIEVGYHYGLKGGLTDSRPSKDPVVFYVKDNGIGIKEKYYQGIFRIFKRLHGRDKFGGGTGMGLTITKKLVERHGGQLWVESTFGEGTTFFFTLHRNSKDVEHTESTHFVGGR